MIDFHSHVLPKFDDGARNAEVGIKMLERAYADGIDIVVSTSHFYADSFSGARDFAEKRDTAYRALMSCAKNPDALPKVVLGAEVYLDKRLSKTEDVHSLCIGDTDYMMLEMPYDKWDEDDFEEIYRLTRLGIRPIMAHLDRFMQYSDKFDELFSLGVLVQVNADAVLNGGKRREILRLFEMEALHVIGSDMHSLNKRPPNAAEAYAVIKNKFGADYLRYLDNCAQNILKNEAPPAQNVHKIKGLKRIFLT